MSKSNEIYDFFQKFTDSENQIAFLKLLADSINEHMFIVDADGVIIHINQKYLSDRNVAPDELIGKSGMDFITLKQRKVIEERLHKRREDRKTDCFEIEAVGLAGDKILMKLKTSPIITADQIIAWLVLAEDITNQRQQEDLLKNSERKLQVQLEYWNNLVDNMHDIFYTYDLNGKITFINKRVEKLLGYKPEELLGKYVWELIPERHKEKFIYIFKKRLNNNYASSYDISVLHKFAGEKIFKLNVSSIIDDGRIIGAMVIAEDVSEKRKAEKELLKTNLELKEVQEELTAANQQLKAHEEELRYQLDELSNNKEILRRSEERYRNILESIEDAYFEVNIAGDFLFYNRALYEKLEYEPEELINKSYRLVMDKDNAQEVFNVFNKVFMTGKVARGFGWYVVKKNGEKIFVETTVLPIINKGIIVGFRGLIRDVSERQKAEQELIKSENLYRTIFENTGTATIIIEEDMYISLINSEMEKLSGYRKDELEGKVQWSKLVARKDLDKMLNYHKLRRLKGVKVPSKYEFTLIKKNGEEREIIVTIDIIPDTKRSVASLLDISDRKISEKAIQDSQISLKRQVDYLNALISNMNELFFTYDLNGKFSFVNKKSLQVMGYSPEELIGKHLVDYVDQENKELIYQAIRNRLLKGEVSSYEISIIHKSGQRRIIKLNASPIIEDDHITGGMILAEDISEKIIAEEKLKYLSFHDALTGLYNRLYLEEEMKRLESGRHNPVGVIICDIDGLKLINDTLGHEKGDQLLIAVAVLLEKCFRTEDVVARVGGDEFAVLLPHASENIINQILSRINETIKMNNKECPELPLSLSIGYAIRDKIDEKMNEILREADNNMYRQKLQSSSSARSNIIKTLAKALGTIDYIDSGHGERVYSKLKKISKALGVKDSSSKELKLLAFFHDIGKVGIKKEVLFKKSKLTEEEYEDVKRHSEIGHRISRSAPDLAIIADWILMHHEWWNGQGYPLGKAANDIPLECRILSVVDAYDAMTTDRLYREKFSHKQALDELQRCSGTQFDPLVVQKFVELYK